MSTTEPTQAMKQTTCKHEKFNAKVSVNRLNREEGQTVDHYMADVSIQCVECGVPFEFIGLRTGVIMDGAATNVDRTELRAAITPQFRFPFHGAQ